MRRTVALVASLLAIALFVPARAQPSAPPADASARAEALVQRFVGANQFSGAVLVARDGKPVFRKAYGLADREWNVPNTPEAKFRLGSLTKAFTATAILQLQEAGKLSLDDPISKYYPDAPPAWKAVTLRHLLTHTSGIPSYTEIPRFFAGEARLDRTPEEIIKLTRDKPLEFPPGSQFKYDNTGYIILGYVIEKVSGQSYADYLRQHIFQPLGMSASGYDSSEAIIPERASGYDLGEAGFINTPYLSMTEPFAAGSLYATVDDMLAWDQSFYGDKLLTAASRKAMFSDYGHGYGFGWFIDQAFGHPRISHSGGINGFVTRFERYPDDRLTVIVLANQTNARVGEIAADLAAIYLGAPPRTAAPGGEAAIRRLIDQIGRGAPDYSQLGPGLADAVREQLPGLQKTLAALGPLQSVTLVSAELDGSDRYRVAFANGVRAWVIVIGKDGKLENAAVEPGK